MRNQYGNYVVQSTLRISQGPEKDLLMKSLYQSLPEITDKKIRNKWEQIIDNAANNIFDERLDPAAGEGTTSDGPHASHGNGVEKHNQQSSS
jgi:hypothetical protein